MTIPRHYQITGVRRIERFGGRALIADPMGSGKSFLALLYAQQVQHLRPIVVICPASIKWQWEQEARTHIGMRSEVLEGTKVPHRKRIIPSCNLVILNYDILKWWIPYLQEIDPQLVIIDEAHYCQSTKSLRTKLVRELCRDVPSVLALTGTPLVNRPAELWPVLNILRPDLYPYFRIYGFRFCSPKMTRWGWEFKGATRLDELHANLKSQLMIRRKKSIILKELPPKTRIVLPLQIKSPRDYEHAQRDIISWLIKNKKEVQARKAARAERLVRWSYLKQLVARLKLPAVFEWLDNFLADTDDKIIVFGIHKFVISAIEERYKKICVKIDGSVTGRKRQLAVEKFQRDPKIRILNGNLKAAGVGLNLTAATAVAKIELGWHPGGHIQAEDRIHRIGQHKQTTCYYLIGKGTIEEDLCAIIQSKQKILDTALDGEVQDDSMDIFDQLERKLIKRAS